MAKANLVLMVGENLFSMEEEVARWKNAFLEKHGDLNYESLSADESKLENLSASILATPFLGEKRLVIIRHFLASKNADEQKKILSSLERLPDSTVLVFLEFGKPDARTALFKYLSKEATLKNYDLPEGLALIQKIESFIHTQQGQIERGAAELLASRLGKDSLALHQEMEKLLLLAKGIPITRVMVEKICQDNSEESIFKLTDELSRRNIKGALQTLRTLEIQGEEASYLFAMILRQVRLLLEIQSHLTKGLKEPEIATKMKVHPYVVKLAAQQCKRFKEAELKTLLQGLLNLDRRLKTGKIHLQKQEESQFLLVLENLLIKL